MLVVAEQELWKAGSAQAEGAIVASSAEAVLGPVGGEPGSAVGAAVAEPQVAAEVA